MPGEVKSWTSRLGPWLAPLAVLALALWSMRVVLPDPVHLIWGDRADTIHHVWGHWWMAQSGAEGGLTTWVSYPTGEWGSVLAPVGSLLVRPVVWLGGAVLAYNLLSLLYLLFDALAVGLLAERVTGSRRAGGIAALVLVVARPVLLHVYLGNTEGLAIGWVALIAWLGRRWDHGTGQRWVGPLIGLLSGVAVIENPYALPILVVGLPILALRRAVKGDRAWIDLLGAIALGLLIPGLRLLQIGEGLGGNIILSGTMEWAGFTWAVYDMDSGFPAWQMLWPWPTMEWHARTHEVFLAGGFSFMGLVGLGLGLAGCAFRWRRALGWLGAAVVLALLGLGSRPMGPEGAPGLFLFMDSVIAQLLPALTQPIRYLAFGAIPLAVAAAIGADAVDRRPWVMPVLVGLLTLEGLLLGGPSIRSPTIDAGGLECFEQLEGPVHVAVDDEADAAESSNGAALLLQLVHEQPGTHRGIGGWAREPEATGTLKERGVVWVLVPEERASAVSCGGWSAVPVEDYLEPARPPSRDPAGPANPNGRRR